MNEIENTYNNETDNKEMHVITGINVGTTDITSTYTDNISRSDTQEFTVTAVSLETISSIDNSTYLGTEIRPLPTITAIVNGETVELENGIDYDLTYSNNINVGLATVTATGKGNFTGTLSTTWNIVQREVTLIWGDTSWLYDGNEHHTTCTAGNLVGGDTCTVMLSGNTITNIGLVTVTATGLSNENYKLPSDVTMILTVTGGLFVRLSGVWTPVKKVFKRVSGEWVEQEFGGTFSTAESYVKVD